MHAAISNPVLIPCHAGDGDSPDNAMKFFLDMKKPHPADRLSGVRYSLLGLGDSNYTRFMAVPRAIRTRLAALGAQVGRTPAAAAPLCSGGSACASKATVFLECGLEARYGNDCISVVRRGAVTGAYIWHCHKQPMMPLSVGSTGV